jgi:hypothetical protein
MQMKLKTLSTSCALVLALGGCASKANDQDTDMMNPGGAPMMPAGSTNTNMMPAASGSGGSASMEPAKKPDQMMATGSGGAAQMMGTAGTGNDMMVKPGDMTGMMAADPRGACTIDSGFPDDHACILPPDPAVGMQIHIGPKDYKNADEVNQYVFHPGQEASECWSFHTPNDKEVYYQQFELSGRAGTHHIINTMYNVEITDGGFTACMDGGTGTSSNIVDNLPGASKAYMVKLPVAPENEHIGRKIGPMTGAQADMHYFNFTDKDILREFWMNIYYVDKEKITETGNQIRGMGGLSWLALPIQPGTHETYAYTCPIDKDGRIIQLLGHYHSHGKRFTAWINRAGGERQKVFEMYDYLDPKTFDYDTITTNPMFSTSAAGAFSGVLDVKAGDSLDWECDINNDSDVALTYTNEVKTGEMCNIWGESVGPLLNCVVP